MLWIFLFIHTFFSPVISLNTNIYFNNIFHELISLLQPKPSTSTFIINSLSFGLFFKTFLHTHTHTHTHTYIYIYIYIYIYTLFSFFYFLESLLPLGTPTLTWPWVKFWLCEESNKYLITFIFLYFLSKDQNFSKFLLDAPFETIFFSSSKKLIEYWITKRL